MKRLFKKRIDGWVSWSKVFQSIPAFAPIIKKIYAIERLPFYFIEPLTPGTNAVFKVGKTVIKLFAPPASGLDSKKDFESELFAQKRALTLGVRVPEIITHGVLDDKYRFYYMIMEYIESRPIDEAIKTMTTSSKIFFAQKLREITDALNIPCEKFNNVDVVFDIDRFEQFHKYPLNFKFERINFLQKHDFGTKVFVHGDLCANNIILDSNNNLVIIDFADACLAPVTYEHATVAVELFTFDQALIKGYFGETNKATLSDICFEGLLIHDFGAEIIEHNISKAASLTSLGKLRDKINEKLKSID